LLEQCPAHLGSACIVEADEQHISHTSRLGAAA
jgi:hypothetical protein